MRVFRPPRTCTPNAITVPTTIIWGTDDAYMSPLLLERSATKVEGTLRVETLHGVSHWVQQEAAELVNAELVTFLQELA